MRDAGVEFHVWRARPLTTQTLVKGFGLRHSLGFRLGCGYDDVCCAMIMSVWVQKSLCKTKSLS